MRAFLALGTLLSLVLALPPEVKSIADRFDGGTPHTDEEAAMDVAKLFFGGIAQGQRNHVRATLGDSGYIEGRLYETAEAYQEAWAQVLRQRSGTILSVNGIEILTPSQMEAKYGKPPDRLKQLPWKGTEVRIAVGNLSGHAAIALLKKIAPGTWRVIGFTD